MGDAGPRTACFVATGLARCLPNATHLALEHLYRITSLPVAAALALLLASKAAGLLAPMYFSRAVDSLAAGATPLALQAAGGALVVSGVCRAVSGLAKELQHPTFTPVSQVRQWGGI